MKLFGRSITKDDIDVDKLLDSPVFQNMFGVNMDKRNNDSEATLLNCLKILSDNVSKLPVKIYKDSDVDRDHYLDEILSLRPNKLMSASTFWKSVEYQVNWHGFSVVAIEKVNDKVKSLIPMDMRKITIYYDNVGLLENKKVPLYFEYEQDDEIYSFNYDEVLYFLGITEDGITPINIREKLNTLIENADLAMEYTNHYIKNGLHSRGVVKYVGDLSENSQTELQERFNRVSGGVKKAGQIMPLPIGFDYQSITTSLKDAQFKELQDLSEKKIASSFGIKPHQLGNLERSTHTNIESQNREFYTDTLHPKFTAYEQEMDYKLLSKKERDDGGYIRFNIDAILRSTLKERYEAYGIGVQNGFLTPNEPRRKENEPPLPGGDKLYFNGNMIPVEMAGQQYVKGGDSGGQDRD